MPRWIVARQVGEIEHVVVDAPDENAARQRAFDGQIVEVIEDHPGSGPIVFFPENWEVSLEEDEA